MHRYQTPSDPFDDDLFKFHNNDVAFRDLFQPFDNTTPLVVKQTDYASQGLQDFSSHKPPSDYQAYATAPLYPSDGDGSAFQTYGASPSSDRRPRGPYRTPVRPEVKQQFERTSTPSLAPPVRFGGSVFNSFAGPLSQASETNQSSDPSSAATLTPARTTTGNEVLVPNEKHKIVHTVEPGGAQLVTLFKIGSFRSTTRNAHDAPRVKVNIPARAGKFEQVWRCAKHGCNYCQSTAEGYTDLTATVAKSHGLHGAKVRKGYKDSTETTVPTPSKVVEPTTTYGSFAQQQMPQATGPYFGNPLTTMAPAPVALAHAYGDLAPDATKTQPAFGEPSRAPAGPAYAYGSMPPYTLKSQPDFVEQVRSFATQQPTPALDLGTGSFAPGEERTVLLPGSAHAYGNMGPSAPPYAPPYAPPPAFGGLMRSPIAQRHAPALHSGGSFSAPDQDKTARSDPTSSYGYFDSNPRQAASKLGSASPQPIAQATAASQSCSSSHLAPRAVEPQPESEPESEPGPTCQSDFQPAAPAQPEVPDYARGEETLYFSLLAFNAAHDQQQAEAAAAAATYGAYPSANRSTSPPTPLPRPADVTVAQAHFGQAADAIPPLVDGPEELYPTPGPSSRAASTSGDRAAGGEEGAAADGSMADDELWSDLFGDEEMGGS